MKQQDHKKDILFLCQFFYPEYNSSATLPFDTAKRLHEAGFQVGALCGYPKEYIQCSNVPVEKTVEGIHIQRIRYLDMRRNLYLGRLVNYFSFTFHTFLNMKRCRDYRSLIVYSNPPVLPLVAAMAKKRYGCKLVFVVYDIYPEIAVRTHSISKKGIITKLMRHINRRVFASVDQVVVLSNQMKDFLVQNRNIAPEKVHVIPNWYADVCEKYNTPDPSHPFTAKFGGHFTVSYLGNMGTLQDMETILEAACLLKDEPRVRFLIAGHGNKFEAIERYIQENDLENVHLYPFLHGEDYHQALAVSSCSIVSLLPHVAELCCPSKAYGYMMAGNPLLILMEDSDLVRDALDNDFGIQVPNGKPEELAQAIRDLMATPEKQPQRRAAAQRCFREKYTTDICTRQYVALFEKLLGKPKQ